MNDARKTLLAPWQTVVLIVLVAIGAASFALGVGIAGTGAPGGMQRGLASLLLSNFYFLSLSLVAAVLIAIHYLVAAGWFVVLRRVLEAMTAYLPIGALLMAAVLLGLPHVYHWAAGGHHTEGLAAKAGYLNTTGFIVRAVAFLAIWLWLAHRMVRESRKQDETGDLAHTRRNKRRSGIFAVLFAFTFTLASIDWLMSLDAHWYSTLFPWYVFSSVLVSGLCWTVMLVAWLRRAGVLPQVNEHHIHDLGKYVFAFSMFWGYLWYSQFMLIWYSNIPEEVTHYVLRTHHGWNALFLANAAVNVILPFFVLMPAVHKRNPRILVTCCAVLALTHWLDLYLLVMPPVSAAGPRLGLPEVGVFLGTAALFLLRFDRSLRGAAVVPTRDPYLEESLHHAG